MNYAIYSHPPPHSHSPPPTNIIFFWGGVVKGGWFWGRVTPRDVTKEFFFRLLSTTTVFWSISYHFVNLLKIKNFFTSVFYFIFLRIFWDNHAQLINFSMHTQYILGWIFIISMLSHFFEQWIESNWKNRIRNFSQGEKLILYI